MFEVKKEDSRIVKFSFFEPFTVEDMKKVLAIIVELCKKEKPFAFFVDTRSANIPPLNAAIILRKWLRENKEYFKKYLICSSIVLSNSTSSMIVKNLITGVFKIQPPVKPNKLFTDYDKCVEWVKTTVDEY